MASWAGSCPGNRESAGIQKGSQTTHGYPYLGTALVQCAWAATRKHDSVFQSRFQARRRGEKRAIIAVAHLMLIILYCMLKEGCHSVVPKTHPNNGGANVVLAITCDALGASVCRWRSG
jgi:transposase